MCRLTREQVIEAIAAQAFDDIGNYLSFHTGEDGQIHLTLKDSAALNTANIQEIGVSRDGRLTLKLYSRERALFKLCELVEPSVDPGRSGLLEALDAAAALWEED